MGIDWSTAAWQEVIRATFPATPSWGYLLFLEWNRFSKPHAFEEIRHNRLCAGHQFLSPVVPMQQSIDFFHA